MFMEILLAILEFAPQSYTVEESNTGCWLRFLVRFFEFVSGLDDEESDAEMISRFRTS